MDCKEIIEKIDIVEYISQYVDLSPKGDEFWGLSPFQEENTPSFSISPNARGFYDYSSGINGDVLRFVMEYHKVGFRKAVEILMKYGGIEDDGEYQNRPTFLIEMKKYLPKKKKEKLYSNRKIMSPNCMDKYIPDRALLSEWVNAGIGMDVLKNHQVRYNPVDNSLVFPLFDNDGNIIAVCSRTLCGREPKYLPYSKFDGVDFLYWEFQSRQNIIDKGEIIIFEGAKSVMAAESYGYNNCVSSQTSHLNKYQVDIIVKLGVIPVFAYDKGVDIRKDKNIKRLSRFTKIEYVQDSWNLLNEKDSPIDNGKKVWDYLYENRKVF